jgi:hypothetical protein
VEAKSWYSSKTVWAGILGVFVAVYNAALTALAQQFGITLPAIPEWIFPILAALGVYGRVSATKVIG